MRFSLPSTTADGETSCSDDGLLVFSASWDRTVRVWSLAAGGGSTPWFVLSEHRKAVWALALAPAAASGAASSTLASASYDGRIIVRDTTVDEPPPPPPPPPPLAPPPALADEALEREGAPTPTPSSPGADAGDDDHADDGALDALDDDGDVPGRSIAFTLSADQ